MGKTDAVRLQHMIDAAQKIVTFVEGRNRKDLDQDEMLSLAVVRLLEILGNALPAQQQGLKVLARSVTLNSTNYSHYEVVPPPEPNGLDSNHTRRGM